MTRKTQTNAADEGQLSHAKDREKLRAQRETDDLKFLLGTPQGRRYIYRKINECGVFLPNVNTNSQIYVREGQRFVGLKLFEEVLAIDPDYFALMMKEAQNDSF